MGWRDRERENAKDREGERDRERRRESERERGRGGGWWGGGGAKFAAHKKENFSQDFQNDDKVIGYSIGRQCKIWLWTCYRRVCFSVSFPM